jgi:hypothetical protein
MESLYQFNANSQLQKERDSTIYICGAAANLSLFDNGLHFPKANCNLDLGYGSDSS